MMNQARTKEREKKSSCQQKKAHLAKRQGHKLDRHNQIHKQSGPGPKDQRLLQLQRTHGNQAVQQLVKERIQPKLEVGRPDDKYEREADRVADRVVQGKDGSGAGGPSVSPRAGSGRALTRSGNRASASRLAARRIDATRSGGKPLSSSEQGFFESRFGTSFGGVRLHTGQQARLATDAINARAFTVGSDVVFGTSEYRPGTTDGRRLLAHELTHVVQQGADGPSRASEPVAVVQPWIIRWGGKAHQRILLLMRLLGDPDFEGLPPGNSPVRDVVAEQVEQGRRASEEDRRSRRSRTSDDPRGGQTRGGSGRRRNQRSVGSRRVRRAQEQAARKRERRAARRSGRGGGGGATGGSRSTRGSRSGSVVGRLGKAPLGLSQLAGALSVVGGGVEALEIIAKKNPSKLPVGLEVPLYSDDPPGSPTPPGVVDHRTLFKYRTGYTVENTGTEIIYRNEAGEEVSEREATKDINRFDLLGPA